MGKIDERKEGQKKSEKQTPKELMRKTMSFMYFNEKKDGTQEGNLRASQTLIDFKGGKSAVDEAEFFL